MRNLRNGLSRQLHEKGRMIDLTRDPKFVKSQDAFKGACRELKNHGKGIVRSYPEISHAGRFNTSY